MHLHTPAAATYGNAAGHAEGSVMTDRDQDKRVQYENSDSVGYAFVFVVNRYF